VIGGGCRCLYRDLDAQPSPQTGGLISSERKYRASPDLRPSLVGGKLDGVAEEVVKIGLTLVRRERLEALVGDQ